MADIIRQDVIQVGFDIDLKELNDLQKELNDIKKMLLGDMGDDAFNGLGESADDAQEDIERLTKENKELRAEIEKLKGQAGQLSNKLVDLGKKGATAAFNGLKKLAGISFKALTVGLAGAATATGVLVKNAVSAYADYEQLVGGVETLFGAGGLSIEDYAKSVGKSVGSVKGEYNTLMESQNLVLKNANDAYKTAGLSANQYMDTITSFSASMIASVGGDTKKAAELSNMAIVDMSDNANKMGTSMDSIIQTYQSLAKGNYAMLDNLKLGYGGTKEELKRLLKDASKLTGKKFKISNYSDVVEAIHAIQENMGITGTTAKEASSTISGSLASMKAAWGNLMPALIQGGDAFDQCVDNLVDSAKTFFKNIKPAITKALSGIGDLITELAPIIEAEFPTLIDELLPPLLKAATALLKGLIIALPSIAKTIINEIPDILKGVGEAIADAFGIDLGFLNKFGDFFDKNGEKIAKFTPIILGLVGAFLLFNKLKGIGSIFSGLFGKGGKGDGKGGIGGFFKGLAEMKTKTVLKGMANLAIIMGGLAIIGGAMALIAPLLAEITDLQSFIEAFGVLTLVAIEGVQMTKAVEPLAKMKTTTVLKGMGNLAIVIGGFTLVTAAFMALAPFMAKIGDAKSFFTMIGFIGVLGLVSTALTFFAKLVGKIPIMTVVKGLANMAIIIAGMSALVMLVGAVSLLNFDYKRMLALVGIIGVLGTVGAALTIFGGICGLIPVATVALGLANMAIIITGMSALFLLLGATSLLDFDYKRILALVGILGVLGTVGAALTVFAGIVGLIPTPIVLAGLANMALVMGGMTALIIAFGALSKVKGIQEFITSGGELLAQLFGVIGKIAGSLIGGFGEAVSESLPAIGKNLAEFGTNIQPLFNAFKDVDMGGVGSFFGALGGFLLQVTGNNILDSLTGWLTGGNSFEQIGKDLTALADGAQGFFTKVATFPENSFTNATKLFEALSGMGSLPNSGGVVGWFCGDVNYSAIASGLNTLSGEGVKKFLLMVAGIAPETFEKTTQFFESLSGLGGLPNSGGLAGWFSGDVNYASIADGLTKLGGEGVKAFFIMAEGLSPKAFENTKLLFESLAGMSESLPKEDNWWDKLWGNEKMSLGDVAADLGTFAKNSGGFFTLINSLNLTNLNGLWASLKNADGLTADISTKVGENIDEMASKMSTLPQKMGDALKNASKPLADSFVEVWTEAVKASVAPVNKLLSGANHILKEFGSKKTVIEWQPYANGTNGHRGGNALVNDGNGAELVQMPNGNTFIPEGRNVFIPNAPKGMKVLPADSTAQLMGRNSPTFKYANGIGNIDIWSYYDNAEGLVNELTKNISYEGMSGFASSLGQGMVSTFAGEMPAWVDKLFEECGQSISSYVASKGVTQWLPTVVRALKMEGQYNLLNVARTLFQMKTESGGNPRAINLWDSNAKKGIPSKGLMQVIDPTFNAYARSGFDKDIYDPMSNILASIRYAVSRYGSLARAYRGVGYENGGLVTQTGTIAENPLHPEWVIPTDPKKKGHALSLWASAGEMLGVSYSPESDGGNYTSNSVEYNTYSPVFEAHFHGVTDERTLKRNVKRWFAESFEEMVDEMDRSNPRVSEV